MEMSRLTRGGTVNPFRETKLSGTYRDRGIIIFPVQLTTSRIGKIEQSERRYIHTERRYTYAKYTNYHTTSMTRMTRQRMICLYMLEGNPALARGLGLHDQEKELPFPTENWVMSRRASGVNTIIQFKP